jgi:hypothetical protein
LKWKLKLMTELVPGECVEYDVTEWERVEEVTLGSLGLSLEFEEGKNILAEIQTQMVAAQIERHGQARRCCAQCGRRRPNKGHYRSTDSVCFRQRARASSARDGLPRLRRETHRPAVHAQVLHCSGTMPSPVLAKSPPSG